MVEALLYQTILLSDPYLWMRFTINIRLLKNVSIHGTHPEFFPNSASNTLMRVYSSCSQVVSIFF